MDQLIRRVRFNPAKVVQRFRDTQLHWLIQFLDQRVHANVLVLYIGLVLTTDMIHCDGNCKFKIEIINKACIFNYTTVNDGKITGVFSSVIPFRETRYSITLGMNTVASRVDKWEKRHLLKEDNIYLKKRRDWKRLAIRLFEARQSYCMVGLLHYFKNEVLAALSLAARIVALGYIFGWELLYYGHDLTLYALGWITWDPMRTAFPILSKCHFQFYGTSNELNWCDSMCMLNYNYVNQNVFAALWFWYFSLALFITAKLGTKLIMLIVASLRKVHLRSKLGTGIEANSFSHFTFTLHIIDIFDESNARRIVEAMDTLLRTAPDGAGDGSSRNTSDQQLVRLLPYSADKVN